LKRKFSSSYQSGPMTVGAAAAANTKGAEAAISIMKSGGNAIDAAIAAGHVMGVVEPLDCGIGAGGFMIIHHADSSRTEVIDFMGTAPVSAEYELYSANDSDGRYVIRVMGQHNQIGHRSVATPGTLRGFEEAHKRYGTVPMGILLQPAIELAENGFSVSYKGAIRMKRTIKLLNRTGACRSLYLTAAGKPPSEGTVLKNRDYAETLREISVNGSRSFYEGAISRLIVTEMENNGAFLSANDLKKYKAIWRKPACGEFRELNVMTVPSPSSGALVFDGLRSISTGPQNQDSNELLVRSMLRMFARRKQSFGDPAFTFPSSAGESSETSSLCTMDATGNAVCLTYSNNNHSGVVIPKTGILLNNQMALFSPWPQNPNQVLGNKRPVSSMMPSILMKNGKVELIIGASGSTRIPTSLMQVLYRVNVENKSLYQAISDPKLHAESETLIADDDLREIAEPLALKLGLIYQTSLGRDTSMGVVQAISRDRENTFTAVGDPRARAQGLVF